MMFKIKQIFDKYSSEVAKVQHKYFNTTSTLNFNAENKKTTFKLDLEDEIISKNIQYYIKLEKSAR